MKLESFIIWLVVLGILSSLHGRVGPELNPGFTSMNQGISRLASPSISFGDITHPPRAKDFLFSFRS